MDPPEYIYKIVPSAPTYPLPKEWPLSELDQQDGFIHLSTASQIPITASLFFDVPSLWVVKIRFRGTGFEDLTKWEVEGMDGAAHLYGANFGADTIDSIEEFKRAEGQSWEDVMKKSTWLV